jgi:uncharacterized repeat protein (TIGR03803 family)
MVGHARNLFSACFILLVSLVGDISPLQAQTATTATISIATHSLVGALQAGDGNFYSLSRFGQTCESDSTQSCSYVYRIAPDGTVSVFHAFPPVPTSVGNNGVNADGFLPVALVFATDGNFYGVCQGGGPGGLGTIFKITPAGEFTVLKSFGVTANNADPGSEPNSLIQGGDGNFYFTNPNGVYQLTPSNSFSTIFTLPSDGSKGTRVTSLMQASDGNFYLTLGVAPLTGTTAANNGAIAQLTLAGQLNIVHSFALDGSEGNSPNGPLVQGSDGNLYGVAQVVINTIKTGVAYKVSPGGNFVLLHAFPGPIFSNWDSALLVGSDGNFYGTTLQGGDTTSANCSPPLGCGTAYQLTSSGTVSTLHTFEGGMPTSTVVADNPQVDGAAPASPLVQGPGGIFYGTTATGTAFTLTLNPSVPAPVQLTVEPTSVLAGSPVKLSWKVLNAFSKTQQVCGAYVQKNAATAGDWTGPEAGTLANGIYRGSTTITPTSAGTYTYALTCGGKESGFVSLLVTGNTPLQIQTAALPKATVSQPYQVFLSVTGGITPYQWTVGGTLPKGLTFDPNGLLSGTPLQFGDYPLVFGVQDSTTPDPQMAGISLDLIVDSGLTLFPTLQNPIVDKPYSQSLNASGGLPPYTFQLTSGALPPGLTFNTTAGVISGTPTQNGPSSFTIKLSDSENPKATVSSTYSMVVGAAGLQITSPSFLPNPSVGVPYSTSLTATGGVPPYSWSFGDNTGPVLQQPQGLTLSLAGVLSGTPIQWNPTGIYDNFLVTVTDSEDPPVKVTRTLSLSVQSTLQMLTTSLPIGQVGTHNETPLMATGGIPPYVWTVRTNGPDPNTIGLFLNDGNIVVEDPLQPVNTTVTISLTDSEKQPAFTNLTVPLTFLPAAFPTTTTLTSSTNTAGTGESVTFTATVVETSGVPAGTVVFYSGGTTVIGTAILDANGKATIQASFSIANVYSITAVYGGSNSSAGSVSAPLTETVVTPTISASISPGSLTIQSGKSGQLVITITPNDGYTGTINFSCGTLPAHVSCTFAPPSLTIAAGSGPVTDTLTVNTNAPTVAKLEKPLNRGTSGGLLAAVALWFPGSLAVVLLGVRRQRKPATRRIGNLLMVALLCFAATGLFTSCGGSMNNSAQPGTYSVPITLTLNGGSTQSVDATVIVK